MLRGECNTKTNEKKKPLGSEQIRLRTNYAGAYFSNHASEWTGPATSVQIPQCGERHDEQGVKGRQEDPKAKKIMEEEGV